MLRKLLLLLLTALLGACALLERPPPIPARPLDVRADCSYRDETGGSGMLRLDVAAARVRAFEAKANFPQHGSCHFVLKDFRQTKEMPAIELIQPSGSCIVRMWEQGKGVTVAFNGCQANCAGDAFSYLWPVLVDARSGRCS